MANKKTVHLSPPDPKGTVSIRIEFHDWPRVVEGDGPESIVRELHTIDFPEEVQLVAYQPFIAVDRGDVGEYAIEAGVVGGPHLFATSIHKEKSDVAYDAWGDGPKALPAGGIVAKRIQVWIHAGTGGANDILRKGQPWSSRPHFGLMLWARLKGHHIG